MVCAQLRGLLSGLDEGRATMVFLVFNEAVDRTGVAAMNALALRSLLGAAWLAVAPLALAEAYRWVDAEGGVHYSAQPPPGHDATRMQLHAGPARADAPAKPADVPAAAAPTAAADATGNDPEAERARAAQVLEQCANARDAIERLRTRPAARYEREDGSYQRYSDAERERMLGEQEEFLRENCN
jgi:hypothetical protein